MGPTILVVDDAPAICNVITDLLTDEGYQVQTAGDGQAALDLIARAPPDLIISDIMMPRCDGLSMLRTMRRAGVMIPVLLISAAPLRSDVVDVPLILKPFDLDSLLTQVTRLLAITRQ